MKPGFCLNIMKRKEILVGRKRGVDFKIQESIDTYLKSYWSLHGGFIDEFLPFFSTSIQEFSSLFVHEFQGCKQSFFIAEYYVTILTPSFMSLALEDELTCTCAVGKRSWVATME